MSAGFKQNNTAAELQQKAEITTKNVKNPFKFTERMLELEIWKQNAVEITKIWYRYPHFISLKLPSSQFSSSSTRKFQNIIISAFSNF